MFSRNVIKETTKIISPALKAFFKHIVPKPFLFLFGSVLGLEAVYQVGSATEGERQEDGHQKLSWSPVGYRNGDLMEHGMIPSASVIFSLICAGEKRPKEIFSPDTVIPIHAENSSRGLFKLQHEGDKILAFSFIATMIAGLVTKNLPVLKMLSTQTIFVTGTSVAYGAYRGNMPVSIPYSLFSAKEQLELRRGILLESSGDKEAALQVYTSLEARNPESQVCRFYMGRLAEELSRDQKEPPASERSPHSS